MFGDQIIYQGRGVFLVYLQTLRNTDHPFSGNIVGDLCLNRILFPLGFYPFTELLSHNEKKSPMQ